MTLLTSRRGADLQSVDAAGVPLFLSSVLQGKWMITSYLVDAGVDVGQTRPNNPETGLMRLLDVGTVEALGVASPVIAASTELDVVNAAGETALFIAVRQGASDAVAQLVAFGASADVPTVAGVVPLQHLLISWHGTPTAIVVLSALLEAPLDLEVRDSAGRTTMHLAISLRLFQAATALLQRGADVAAVDSADALPSLTFFGLAPPCLEEGFVELRATLLARCTAAGLLDAQGPDGKTALFLAVDNRDVDGVATLLEAGATADVGSSVEAPVHAAVRQDNHALVELLIPHATLTAQDAHGDTPLAIAVSFCLVGLCKLLCTHEAARDRLGPGVTNADGNMAVHLLAVGLAADAVRAALWNQIADQVVPLTAAIAPTLLDTEGADGVRPAFHALSVPDTHVLFTLAEHGATVDFVDRATGLSPLSWACAEGRELSVVDFLCRRTTEHLDTQDPEGRTALWIATAADANGAVDAIVGRGANVNAVGVDALTPLMVATQHQNPVIATCLLDAHAELTSFPDGTPLISHLMEASASSALVSRFIAEAKSAELIATFADAGGRTCACVAAACAVWDLCLEIVRAVGPDLPYFERSPIDGSPSLLGYAVDSSVGP
jgi:ankyrin repeat protein